MDKFVLKGPYQPTGDQPQADRGACKRVPGRQSMPDVTGGYGFSEDFHHGQRNPGIEQADAGHRPQ